MTFCAPRALADALKREQRQNHAGNITVPRSPSPPAGRLGRARGCRGRSGKSLTCPAGSCAQKWACQRSERAPGHAPGASLVHFDMLEPVGTAARHRAAVFPAKTGPESGKPHPAVCSLQDSPDFCSRSTEGGTRPASPSLQVCQRQPKSAAVAPLQNLQRRPACTA
jgi:hypothetical protein